MSNETDIEVESESLYSDSEITQMRQKDLRVETQMLSKKRYSLDAVNTRNQGILQFAGKLINLIEHKNNSDEYEDWTIDTVVQYLVTQKSEVQTLVKDNREQLKKVNARSLDIVKEQQTLSTGNVNYYRTKELGEDYKMPQEESNDK
tara:strand:- start:86 stop:526 length:441 start_codon:yes stop_codon:yes gene_type:complete